MPRSSQRSRLLGWAGLLLCLPALVAVAIPGVGYVRAMNSDGLSLSDGPQRVSLHAGQSYGIYVDDANNSGYSESCSAVGSDGQRIPIHDPPWSISSSDTENLDFAFRAGPGELTISCDVPGERVTLRPLPNNRSLLIGILLAAVLGCGGLGMLLAWTVRSGRTSTSPPGMPFESGTASPWIVPGGHQGQAYAATLTQPDPVRHRDLVPAIVATTIALPILGLAALGWLMRILVIRSVWNDPELWNGAPPGAGPSMWQTAQSTWTDLVPIALGVVLVLAAWRLAWRDLTAAAWGAAVLALVIGIGAFIL